MVTTAKKLNPQVHVLLRTHSDEEMDLLRKENMGTVFMGEHELALSMNRTPGRGGGVGGGRWG